MKITIIPTDQIVIVDGVAVAGIDMSGVSNIVQAVQWDGISGFVEYNNGDATSKIDTVADYQIIIDRYVAIRADEEAKALDPYFGLSATAALEKAKSLKSTELLEARATDANRSITVGDHTYPGGRDYAFSLKGQYDLIDKYVSAFDQAVNTVDFLDVTGAIVTLPMNHDTEIDALDVMAAVGQAYELTAFRLAEAMAALKSADTVEAVLAITY